jgi:O-antigen ligase
MNSISTTYKTPTYIFYGLLLVTALSFVGVFLFESWLVLGLPVLALGLIATSLNLKLPYYLLLATIPLSLEFHFSNGYGTDLPTEPLIVGIMLLYFLNIAFNPKLLEASFLKHPIIILLSIHVCWTFFTSLLSTDIFTSLKFFLAKIWYLVTFVFATAWFVKDEKGWQKCLHLLWFSMVFATIWSVFRHWQMEWGFREINDAVQPFFRNHVNYAALLTILLPFGWFEMMNHKKGSKMWWGYSLGLVIMLFAISTAYTRAAYLAIIIAIGAYWALRFRFFKISLFAGIVLIFFAVNYFVTDNKYMDYRPSEKTVAHEGFNDIVSATSKLEDVSTMERYYRWVAAFRMIGDKPWVGFGPSRFYANYKDYTLSSFRTWVSNNPEKSGLHCYYLMIMVDQGVPGFIFFLILTIGVLLIGERVWRETVNIQRKRMVISAILTTIIIDAFILINDLLESDKVGSIYFIAMTLIVLADLLNKKEKRQIN